MFREQDHSGFDLMLLLFGVIAVARVVATDPYALESGGDLHG